MTISEMLQQSGILTLLGMAVVFVFLWVMIIIVNFVSKVIGFTYRNSGADQSKNHKSSGGVQKEHIAAISIAVTEYQKEG